MYYCGGWHENTHKHHQKPLKCFRPIRRRHSSIHNVKHDKERRGEDRHIVIYFKSYGGFSCRNDVGTKVGEHENRDSQSTQDADHVCRISPKRSKKIAVDAHRAKLIEQYEAEVLNSYQAAELGYVDEVIAPYETRVRIISSSHLFRFLLNLIFSLDPTGEVVYPVGQVVQPIRIRPERQI